MYALVKVEKNEVLNKGIVLSRGDGKVTTYTTPDFEYKRHFLFIVPYEQGDEIKWNSSSNYFPVVNNIYALAEMWDDIRELCEFLLKENKEIEPIVGLLVREQLKRAFEYSQTPAYRNSKRGHDTIDSIWDNIFKVMEICGKTFEDCVSVETTDDYVSNLIKTYDFEMLDKFFSKKDIVRCSAEKFVEYEQLNIEKDNAISFIRSVIKEKGNNFVVKEGDRYVTVSLS